MIEWLEKAHYPVPSLITNLIFILGNAETQNWIEVKYKKDQLSKIEKAAKCIETFLPRNLRSGDIITDTWLRETSMLVAAALREKKMWILTPKKDTYDNFVKSIASTITCIVIGNWDALEKMEKEKFLELEKASRSKRWRLRMIRLFRTVFVAIIPLVIVLILQWTSLALSGTFREYTIIGTIVWAALTLISTIDSNFGIKISAIKDIASLFPSSGQDNKP